MKGVPAIAAGLILAILPSTPDWAIAGGDLVKFPESYAQGVHYATVERGNITAELFVNRSAIDAAKSGRRLLSGTVPTTSYSHAIT